MNLIIKLLLIAALAINASAIYPSDHWDYSKKLTTENFTPSIEAAIGEDKTVFVRWIASEG